MVRSWRSGWRNARWRNHRHLDMCNVKYNMSPCCRVGDYFQTAGITDQFIQDADNLLELGSVVSVFLPAVQHQLIQGSWAVHRWWQAVPFINSLNYLHKDKSFWELGGTYINLFLICSVNHINMDILCLNKCVYSLIVLQCNALGLSAK